MDDKTRAELLRVLTEARSPFLVPVPRPYIVDLAPSREHVSEARLSTLRAAGVLWSVLNELNVSLEEAYAKDYTLNVATYDELGHLAFRVGKPAGYRALDLLNNGLWKR